MTTVTARDAFGLCMAVVLLPRQPRALVGIPRTHLMIDRLDTMMFGGLYSHFWLQRVIACFLGPLRATLFYTTCSV